MCLEHLKHMLDFLNSTFSFNLQTLLVSLILSKNLQLKLFDFDQAFLISIKKKKDHALLCFENGIFFFFK